MNIPHSYAVAAVGTTRQIAEQFLIAAVQVDNPSDMWLYIPELYSYIPPNRLGWIAEVNPKIKSMRLQYVNAPTNGKASAVSGGPIVLTTFSAEQAISTGVDYTTATQQDLADVLAAIQNLLGGYGGGVTIQQAAGSGIIPGNNNGVGLPGLSVTIIAATPAIEHVVVFAAVRAFGYYDDGSPDPWTMPLSDQVGFTIGGTLYSGALTPNKNSDSVVFPAGMMRVGINTSVDLQAFTVPISFGATPSTMTLPAAVFVEASVAYYDL